ncbi:MAG: orotate phosphoribosyltransferase [Candidatus Anstonellaceae archaeon]
MQKFQRDFIELACFAGALKFGQFTLKSGRQSPYFFNSGVFYTGEFSNALASILADFICFKLKPEKYDVIFGPAYKGIPLAVSVSMALARKGINKPWCFNRKEEKGHGEGGSFVGASITDGTKVVMVDDVFTTGAAKEDALALLSSAAKISLVGVFIMLDRQERSSDGKNAVAEFEAKHGTKVYAIVSATEVFDYLHENTINGKQYVDDELYSKFLEYRSKYGV